MRITPALLFGSLLGALACNSGETPARPIGTAGSASLSPIATAGTNAPPASNAGAGGVQPAPIAGGSGAGAAGSTAGGGAGVVATAGAGGGTTPPAPMAGNGPGAGAGGAPASPTGGLNCAPRVVGGEPQLHFHHIHFNSPEPATDIEYFVKFHNGMAVDFCTDMATGAATKAIKTERGHFLFTDVEMPPDAKLNSHLEHVGYISANPGADLRRFMDLDAPIWPVGDNLQCAEVAMGTACFMNGYFYMQAPNGARIEIAQNPKPPMSGFGHIHLRGEFPDFYAKVLGPSLMGMMDMASYQAQHVDQVNITNMFLASIMPVTPVVESKGKPIDHIAYSTTDLMAHHDRIKGMGIPIAEDISFKPEYGFKSFFIKSPNGVWVEIVEDSQFKP